MKSNKPITLLSALSKIYEPVISSYLQKDVCKKNQTQTVRFPTQTFHNITTNQTDSTTKRKLQPRYTNFFGISRRRESLKKLARRPFIQTVRPKLSDQYHQNN